MAAYVQVNGVPMWYDERGEGDPLVLLHGGLTDSRDFTGNLDTLASRFRLLLPERRGHGHTADAAGPITLEVMAQDTIAFLDKLAGGPVRLVGYSGAVPGAAERPVGHRPGGLAPAAAREPRVVHQVGQRLPDLRSCAHHDADPPRRPSDHLRLTPAMPISRRAGPAR